MSNFTLSSVRCSLGFECGGLSPAAEQLERTVEFKRTAQKEFRDVFVLDSPHHDFEYPYRSAVSPVVRLEPNAYGDLDPLQVDAFAASHLDRHGPDGMATGVAPSGHSICIIVLEEWITVGGYSIELDGQLYQASKIVEDFRSSYAESRGDLPPHFESSCEEIASLPVSFFVSYPV